MTERYKQPVLIVFVCFQAIQNPNDFTLQERAWNSVCPLVIKLKRFYSFSLRLGTLTAEKQSFVTFICSKTSPCSSDRYVDLMKQNRLTLKASFGLFAAFPSVNVSKF